MRVTRKSAPKGLTSRVGRICWFIDPRNGETVEGFYTAGRKVERTVKARPMTPAEFGEGEDPSQPRHPHGYMLDVQTFTVPPHIKITFGLAPVDPTTSRELSRK